MIITVTLLSCLGSRFSISRVSAQARGLEGTPSDTPVEDAAPPAGYRELVEDALREYDLRNYEEARSLFLRAHGLFPSARTHRGVGAAEFELRDYPAAISQLEAALSSHVRPLAGELRVATELLLERARNFVAHVSIETKPAAEQLVVDGASLSTLPDSLLLKVGEHDIEAHLTGYATERRRISVRGGEREKISIVFSRREPNQEALVSQRRWYRNPWVWTAVGAAVLAGVGATMLATRDDTPARAKTDLYVRTPSETP